MRSILCLVTVLAVTAVPVIATPVAASPPGVPAVCDGVPATIVGTSGDDVLRGTDGRDVVQALEGDDLVRGLAGDDLLCGGIGADQVDGGRGDDVLWGGSDSDPGTSPEPAGDVLVAGPGDDVVHGGATPNDGDGFGPSYRLDVADYGGALSPLVARFVDVTPAIVRGQGRDRLDGIYAFSGGRADDDVFVRRQEMRTLLGGDGDDHFDVKAVASTIDAGPGDDVVERGYVVLGGHGDDRLLGPVRRGSGGIGADLLVGRDDQSDRLAGDGGRDRLRGLGGDDRLDGGGGVDALDGGAGRDTCTTGERLAACED